jgi:Ser/Thr protein kinase RdoA (MazF antagonist)
MTWVDGELMTAIGPASSTLLIDIGRVSAVLTHALKKTRVPTGLPRHKWMAEYGGISLRRALSNLPESFEVDILKEILSFHEKYDSKYQGLPRSTVHQDLNDHNLLVDKRFPDRIAGVIDFNDTVTTIRVADVALAAAYGMLRQPDPVGSFLDVVRGYERSQQLTASERKVIFPISITRLCINWATWRVKELVEGKTVYGSARTRSTWPVIEHIVNLGLNSTQEHVLNSIPSCV